MYRIGVGGCRFFSNYLLLQKEMDLFLHELQLTDDIVIISGHCRGADIMAEKYAKEREYSLRLFPAKWSEYGRCAGVLRNREIVENSDIIIVFWDGKSKGTKNLIDNAISLSKPYKIVYINIKPPT